MEAFSIGLNPFMLPCKLAPLLNLNLRFVLAVARA